MTGRLVPESVRAAAGRARALAEQHRDTGDALLRSLERLARGWRGRAADAALTELSRTTRDTRVLAHACADAADVLLTCAGRLEHAWELGQRAERAERQDEVDKSAVRLAVGVQDLPPWLELTPLHRQALSLAHQSEQVEADAVHDAVAALQELTAQVTALRPLGWRRLTLGEQLSAVPVAAARGVADTALLALSLFPGRALVDREGWVQDIRSLGEGVEQLAQDPYGGLEVLLGIDLLQDGQYGAWVGGLVPDAVAGVLTGGAVPLGRRGLRAAEELSELASEMGRLEQVRAQRKLRPEAGGPVVPREGAVLAPGMPRVIRDLAPQARTRVLDRGRTGFPADWADEEVVDRVMATARHPEVGERDRQHYVVQAEHGGLRVRVVLQRDGTVVTGYAVR